MHTQPQTPPHARATEPDSPATPADTPMAGLKLLSRLASPHLRDLQQERRSVALLQIMRREREDSIAANAAASIAKTASIRRGAASKAGGGKAARAAGVKRKKPSNNAAGTGGGQRPAPKAGRKDKSLSLISEKFIRLYQDGDVQEVSLDVAAQLLGVERRRIYDIVNVLEGLEVVVRKAKNTYTWFGLKRLAVTFAKLKLLLPTHLDSPIRVSHVKSSCFLYFSPFDLVLVSLPLPLLNLPYTPVFAFAFSRFCLSERSVRTRLYVRTHNQTNQRNH